MKRDNKKRLIFTPPPEWQQKRLANWLKEWRIDQAIKDTELENQPSYKLSKTDLVLLQEEIDTSYDAAPRKAGEIRLLSPDLVADADRPIYVAVFRQWTADSFLVAPYGPYSESAVPGELLTGRAERPLRVLCLWNTHSISTEVLAETWFVDQLSTKEMVEAWAVFQHVLTGHPLPKQLEQRVGPPMYHPQDPRLKYQAEQVRLLANLPAMVETPVKVREGMVAIPWFEEYEERSTQLLAAKDKTSSLSFDSYYDVTGRNLSLHVYLMYKKNCCAFVILNRNNNPSKELDGTLVVSAKKSVVSSPFNNGLTTMRMRDLKQGFFLRLKNGTTLILKPRK